ncbi:MAG: hypothetical protein JSU65_00305, partial [Candidatus Zixiibacteriota bacterium]
SDSLGLAWTLPANITNYPRTGDQSSHAAWWETYVYLDSDDGLHIIWNAIPVVADPYNDPSMNWNDLSCSIFHWTDRVAGPSAGGTITRIHNAEWGPSYLYEACGAGESILWLGFFSISECNGRLYTIFNQYLDAWGNWGDPQVNDCADANYSVRANGEIALCVSSSLDGLLWDAARNLTNTYTPNCSTVSSGGVCMDELKPTMSRYGMDSSAYGQELAWPEEELVDPSGGSYDGSHYLHIFYMEDHFPGWGYFDEGPLTLNPLKWIRLACVDPVPASQIITEPAYIGYPAYTQHNATDTVVVTVRNDGNTSLNVTRIAAVEEPGPYAGWLGLSDTALAVPAGVDNIATFSMYLNEEQQVNDPGTVVWLKGEVYLLSNADNDDSLSILVDCLVADTVIGGEWDTLATSMSARQIHPGDFTRLVVNNLGEMGSTGSGAVNLDFSTDGGECDPEATVYLCSGGPIVLRRDIEGTDTSYVVNCAMYQDDFATDLSFKPVTTGVSSGEFSGSNYDGYRTGTIVNRDSTMAVEREYYAPTGGADSTDFIVMRTEYYSFDGSTHQGLALAEVIDWDIPSDNLGDNTAGVFSDYNVVYLQGADAGPPGCQENTNRFGAMMLLGYQTNHDFVIDSCWSNCTPYGIFAGDFHQWWDMPSGMTVWDSLEANPGLNDNDFTGDQAVFTTYLFDYDLGPTDTLTLYSAVTSVHDGDTTDLKVNLEAAFEWYRTNLRPGCTSLCGCCIGLTGNVDGDPNDICDIGDLTKLIDFLFISYTPPECMEEANCDGLGSVDIGDLTKLIDFLFISYTPPAGCL